MKIRFKHIIRSLAAWSFYYSGIAPAILWLRARHKTVILTYHHVIPDDHGSMAPLPPGTYVTQKTFERHMQHINRLFTVISLTEFCAPDFWVNDSKRFCLITFDDGWRDNLWYASKILQRYDLPATVFVATRYVGEAGFHGIDKIVYYLVRMLLSQKVSHQELVCLMKSVLGNVSDCSFNEGAVNDETVFRITEALKKIDMAELEKLCHRLADLADRLKLDSNNLAPEILDWKDLRQLQHQGIEIGAHSHHHSNLTQLTEDQVRSEAAIPQRLIEQHLGTQAIAFAYPDGKWNAKIAEHVQQAGYRCAFTNSFGYHRNGYAFSIPRINIHEDIARSKALFACELSGVFHIIKNLTNKIISRTP